MDSSTTCISPDLSSTILVVAQMSDRLFLSPEGFKMLSGNRAQIPFPTCWNGVDLYRVDGSHVAHMSQIDKGSAHQAMMSTPAATYLPRDSV